MVDIQLLAGQRQRKVDGIGTATNVGLSVTSFRATGSAVGRLRQGELTELTTR